MDEVKGFVGTEGKTERKRSKMGRFNFTRGAGTPKGKPECTRVVIKGGDLYKKYFDSDGKRNDAPYNEEGETL